MTCCSPVSLKPSIHCNHCVGVCVPHSLIEQFRRRFSLDRPLMVVFRPPQEFPWLFIIILVIPYTWPVHMQRVIIRDYTACAWCQIHQHQIHPLLCIKTCTVKWFYYMFWNWNYSFFHAMRVKIYNNNNQPGTKFRLILAHPHVQIKVKRHYCTCKRSYSKPQPWDKS